MNFKRNIQISLLFLLLGVSVVRAREVSSVDSLQTKPLESELAEASDSFCHRMHLKTNAVDLAMAIANFGLEFDLCRHLSLSIPYRYSAWDYWQSPAIKFRVAGVSPELRTWFKATNNGWFLGFHGSMLHYNVAVGGKYRYQDKNGSTPAWGGGLTVGCRVPMGKKQHWHVEFALGGGAYNCEYDVFYNRPNGLQVGTEKRWYYGLDTVSISFSYSFDLQSRGGNR